MCVYDSSFILNNNVGRAKHLMNFNLVYKLSAYNFFIRDFLRHKSTSSSVSLASVEILDLNFHVKFLHEQDPSSLLILFDL